MSNDIQLFSISSFWVALIPWFSPEVPILIVQPRPGWSRPPWSVSVSRWTAPWHVKPSDTWRTGQGPSPWDPEVPGKDNHEAGLEMTWDFRATFWIGHDGPKMSSILPFCWWISGAGEGHDRACRREVPWLNSNIDHAPSMLSFCLTWEPPRLRLLKWVQ